MSKTEKKIETFGPNQLDVRVRERFLASGQLEPKALEKHHAELPDVADRGEAIALRQPALSASVDADLPDDEDDE